MPYTANLNSQFRISGILLGEYVFGQNPSTYSSIPPLQSYTQIKTIEGNDVYQKHFIDNELREMSWDIVSSGQYSTMRAYSTRDANGNIYLSWFSDQRAKMLNYIPCRVIDVIGSPIAGNPDYFKVNMKIKPESYFTKIYEVSVSGYGG
jgi:hypothetical protein